ncbi:MAG: CAP domain-containing protein [Thermoleophilaceae bacterium]
MTRLKTLALTLAFAAILPANALANCGAAADRDPAAPGVSLKAARTATLCLLNSRRRHYNERRLRFNHRLALAGLRHARDMVAHKYFAHDAPSGQDFVQRIFKTDYVPASASYTLGENLAWGDSRSSTPREIVAAWMASPGHRSNILAAGFHEIGIAIVVGAPVSGVGRAATYATEFGTIHRH